MRQLECRNKTESQRGRVGRAEQSKTHRRCTDRNDERKLCVLGRAERKGAVAQQDINVLFLLFRRGLLNRH